MPAILSVIYKIAGDRAKFLDRGGYVSAACLLATALSTGSNEKFWCHRALRPSKCLITK